ncbi:SDR family NAD(P)-dependent oxidoreductase [Nonomuraea turkmeniaca]|uniref:SDR family NAD(P)-dependent oxidoreductase n=1 Tax=Nonomuraea turkmeniaca TaxID=103838 RepID=A0A5S4FIV1_9ACTN|nr:SDR family NAD(P)-dependent oxidoreductase [Nonomuraea turkmeniaca]TMR08977.1 SDR family NAD(P)-dependent oxidoreductase [Nonomuraea turkmeniaca]
MNRPLLSYFASPDCTTALALPQLITDQGRTTMAPYVSKEPDDWSFEKLGHRGKLLTPNARSSSRLIIEIDGRCPTRLRQRECEFVYYELPTPVKTDGSYLVTGGLGGLGLLTVGRLAERGARCIVLCGRTHPSDSTAEKLQDLRTRTGADIHVVLGDIADPTTVQRALTASAEDGATLRGIVHAAGVIEDATLANVDDELLARVWRGKADGAWTLHQATLDHDLDFFVVYSSLASLIGSPGQGAYAAANAYLDALVGYRLSQGLPATGIHWGAWSQVGRGRHLAQRGFLMISPDDGLDALERILAEGHSQLAYSPIEIVTGVRNAGKCVSQQGWSRAPPDRGLSIGRGLSPVREQLVTSRGQAQTTSPLDRVHH